MHTMATMDDTFSDNEDTLNEIHPAHTVKGLELYDLMNKRDNLNMEINHARLTKAKYEVEIYEADETLQPLKKELELIIELIEGLNAEENSAIAEIDREIQREREEIDKHHQQRIDKLREETEAKCDHEYTTRTAAAREKQAKLEQEIASLTAELANEVSLRDEKLEDLKRTHANRRMLGIRALDGEISNLTKLIANLDQLMVVNEKKYKRMSAKLISAQDEENLLIEALAAAQKAHEAKQNELVELREQYRLKMLYISTTKASFATASDTIDDLHRELAELLSALAALETRRRTLHNKLQDLKGNIRVFCRMRPVDALTPQFTHQVDPKLTREGSETLTISDGVKLYAFPFDQVFTPSTTNEAIFEEIWQLVQLAMDGYNVCVFAYGQTGSGKTYTMSQPQTGMIPLALDRVFGQIAELEPQGWTYTLTGQVLEIYNDNIVDLAAPAPAGTRHDIKHDEDTGVTTVTNTAVVPLALKADAHALVARADAARSTGATKMNERSSRSHLVFIVTLDGTNSKTGETSHGRLNLIDLAGSERLSASQARGERLKETQAINKLLSALGDVIYSLSRGLGSAAHIPYRNLRLTYLLKNLLGGNLKTLMFVNISPAVANFSESVNSLRFATKVNTTKLAATART